MKKIFTCMLLILSLMLICCGETEEQVNKSYFIKDAYYQGECFYNNPLSSTLKFAIEFDIKDKKLVLPGSVSFDLIETTVDEEFFNDNYMRPAVDISKFKNDDEDKMNCLFSKIGNNEKSGYYFFITKDNQLYMFRANYSEERNIYTIWEGYTLTKSSLIYLDSKTYCSTNCDSYYNVFIYNDISRIDSAFETLKFDPSTDKYLIINNLQDYYLLASAIENAKLELDNNFFEEYFKENSFLVYSRVEESLKMIKAEYQYDKVIKKITVSYPYERTLTEALTVRCIDIVQINNNLLKDLNK